MKLKGPRPPDVTSDLNALDLCFSLDATGSMQPWIDRVREIVIELANAVAHSPSRPSLRFALVEYRDHHRAASRQAPVVTSGFTTEVEEFRSRLRGVRCSGGADHPEAVADGLAETLKLPWRRQAQKAVVLIGDAPPHGVGSPGDTYPRGCPCGLNVEDLSRQAVARGVVVHAVAVTNDAYARAAFQAAAKMTGGEFATLVDAHRLAKILTALAVTESRKVADDLDVAARYDSAGGDIDRLVRATGLSPEEVRASIDRLRAKEAIAVSTSSPVGSVARPSRVRIRR